MNKNEEKDLEIIVKWEEEKEIKTVEELDKFIDKKENNKSKIIQSIDREI